MLQYLISSKTERDLLVLFFTNPSSYFYIRDICRRISQQPNAVIRELKKLENAGLLVKKEEGNLVYYGINRLSPVFKELKAIILKSILLTDIFIKHLRRFSKNINYAFIYGSYAKCEERVGSDIDIMIVGDLDSKTLNKIFTNLEKNIKREINYNVMPTIEFNKKKNTGFISRILKDKKIMLIGDENELRELAKGR